MGIQKEPVYLLPHILYMHECVGPLYILRSIEDGGRGKTAKYFFMPCTRDLTKVLHRCLVHTQHGGRGSETTMALARCRRGSCLGSQPDEILTPSPLSSYTTWQGLRDARVALLLALYFYLTHATGTIHRKRPGDT